MAVAANSAEIYELVAGDAEVERLATGLVFTEGPVWHPDGYLLFSDVAGNVVIRWDESGEALDWRRPSNHANGLVLDAEYRLLACEHDRSVVTRTEHDGRITIVASHYQEKELNSPNDVIVASDGSVWFTDPHPAGRTAAWGVERPAELDWNGVYRLPPGGGEPELLVDDFEFPNGLCLSPDEAVLYVNDTLRMHIRAFDVRPDWTLANGRELIAQGPALMMEGGRIVQPEEPTRADPGFPDGMKCDERGNLYCTGPGGVWVIAPGGEHLGTIQTPEIAANMAWGGDDRRTLYITASTSLYRIEMKVRGAALPHLA